MLVVGLLYMAVSGFLVLVSFGLAGNDQATIAFEGANIAAAVWLLLIAALMCPLSITGAYGAREHNKFCLFSFCTVTLVLIFTMWGVAGTLERLSWLPIEEKEVLRCLSYGLVGEPAPENTTLSDLANNNRTMLLAPSPSEVETDEDAVDPCILFASDPYVRRLRDLWVHLHDRAFDIEDKESKIWNTFLVKMQKGSIAGYPCCGFFRPGSCSNLTGASCSGANQKVEEDIYYEATQICSQGRGGCRYDKPMGICAYEEMEAETSGCAFTMKRWIQGQMDSTATTINLFSVIPVVGWIYSLCLTFKRKDVDVLPEKYVMPKLPPKLDEVIVTVI